MGLKLETELACFADSCTFLQARSLSYNSKNKVATTLSQLDSTKSEGKLTDHQYFFKEKEKQIGQAQNRFSTG